MPYINLKTSCEITKEKELSIKKSFGKAIETFPGKTEKWLMVSFEDNSKLYFHGENKDGIAMVNVSIFGSADSKCYELMTQKVCEILEKELNIKPENVYVKYEESNLWGWNNINF